MVESRTKIANIINALGDPRGDFQTNATPYNEIYTSEDFYEFEKYALFSREWVCVGRLEDIPNGGDHFTVDIAGAPVIIVNGNDGKVRAMSGVCRHRGACLTMPSQRGIEDYKSPQDYIKGNTRHFRCPYHWWTFDLEGQLIGAPAMEKTKCFNKDNFSLPQFRCEIWHGFIMVNLNPEAESLEGQTDEIDDILNQYNLSEMKTLCPDDLRGIPCNWKIFLDNSIDHYHASRLHAGIHDNAPSAGLVVEPVDINRPVTLAWMNLSERDASFTITGRPVFPVIETLSDQCRDASFFINVMPNLMLFGQPDLIIAFLFFPTAVDEFNLKVLYLLPEKSCQMNNSEELLIMSKQQFLRITEQDLGICASMQKGQGSPFWKAGMFSWQEGQLVGLHKILYKRYIDAFEEISLEEDN